MSKTVIFEPHNLTKKESNPFFCNRIIIHFETFATIVTMLIYFFKVREEKPLGSPYLWTLNLKALPSKMAIFIEVCRKVAFKLKRHTIR